FVVAAHPAAREHGEQARMGGIVPAVALDSLTEVVLGASAVLDGLAGAQEIDRGGGIVTVEGAGLLEVVLGALAPLVHLGPARLPFLGFGGAGLLAGEAGLLQPVRAGGQVREGVLRLGAAPGVEKIGR